MNKLLIRLVIFMLVCIATNQLSAQNKSGVGLSHDQLMGINHTKKEITPSTAQQVTYRLDLVTESQKDELLHQKEFSVSEICNIIINCPQSPNGALFYQGDKIKVFADSRLKEIQLIKVSGNKSTIVSQTTANGKIAFLKIPITVSREDNSYRIRFI